jgi:cell division transport system permease protein
MKSFFYHLKSAFENIKLNQTMVLFSLVSLSFTLMLFGIFLLFYYNVQDFVQTMRESVQFSVYLKEASTGKTIQNKRVQEIEQDLKSDVRIASFIYISKEEALETFNSTFQDRSLLERLGENPFPASFEVKVKTEYQEPEKMKPIIAHFEAMPLVEEVRYASDWINNLLIFLRVLKAVGVGIGASLALTVTSNIANTIRLHFYNRREEIEIMKLIGATHGFIKIPFVLEGLFMGGISGLLSVLFLFSGFEYSKGYLLSIIGAMGRNQGLQFLPVEVLFSLIFFGALLGGAGSFISLGHLLTLRNPELAKRKVHRAKESRIKS